MEFPVFAFSNLAYLHFLNFESSLFPKGPYDAETAGVDREGAGTNCDEETKAAWELAGAEVETRHAGRLLESTKSLDDFQALTIPGGFSYGDDLGAGRILATRLGLGVASELGDALLRLRDRGGLILGVCNGFQVLVKAGLLPGAGETATLTHNDSGRFEARWVRLASSPGLCPFIVDDEPIELPVAHGEGKFLAGKPETLAQLETSGQIVLRYVDQSGRSTQSYPSNPNGSLNAIAGLCDSTGRVFGLMPHPERYVGPTHHPRWTRLGLNRAPDGLKLFRNAVKFLESA